MRMKNRRLGSLHRSVILAILAVWIPILAPWAAHAGSPEGGESIPRRLTAEANRKVWPHEISDLQPDPALHFGRLPNGFRYVVLPNAEPRHRVSMHLDVQVGSLNETEDQRGLAHFLEHLMFNGSTHFAPGELVKYFQRIGMQFGPDANAHTGFQETVYDILLPDGKSDSLEKGLLVLSDYAQGALLLPSEVAGEAKVILSEMRARDSASYRMLDASFKFEFKGTRVGRRLPIGLAEVIRGATSASLKKFYDTWYRPETMILVLVGDFNADAVVPLIEKYFGSLQPRAPAQPDPEMGALVHTGVNPFYHYEKEAGKTTVSIGTLQQQAPEADSVAAQLTLTLQHLADQILQNRLDRIIAHGESSATSARIGSGRYLRRFNYGEISAESDPDRWEATLGWLEQTLRQALVHGFTLGEVERVKKEFLADLDVEVSKASTRDSQALAREIIWHLNNDRVMQSPLQRRERLQAFVRSLTPGDVHRALQQVWSGNRRQVMVTGNAIIDTVKVTPEQAILNVYNHSRQVVVGVPQAPEKAVFPYLPRPSTTGEIVSRTGHADLDITQIKFANGVYLNFKHTAFKANEVQAALSFGSGRMSQPLYMPGLSELSEAVVNASGLGQLDKEALSLAMAGTSTDVTFRVAEDRFVFEGHTISENVERLFQLLYAHLQDPAYRVEALALSKKRLKQQFESYQSSVEGQLQLYGFRFLAGGDSRFGFPQPSEWNRLTLAQVGDWIGGALDRGPLELSVVGDCDRDVVVALAARYFGSLKSRPDWPKHLQTSGPRFPASAKREFKVATKIPKGLVAVTYATDDFWDIHRTRRLAVLSEVLSDRLRLGIREKRGASYAPFAYSRSSRAFAGYGFMQTYIQVDPQSTAAIVEAVESIVSNLTEQGIADEELHRALDPILTGLKDLRRSNRYWLNSVLACASRYPQQIEWSRTILDDYAAVTAADLMQLVHQYLRNDKAAVMTFIPQTSAD